MEWNDVDPRPEGSGKNGGKSKFLNLKPGEYKIRPVGKPKEVRRYFVQNKDGSRKMAISDQGPDTCIIMKKYRSPEGEPMHPQRTRYAFNCIDRADKELKIVEVPASVARQIRNWGAENQINPGSGKGVDFKIKVIRSGPDPRNTKYDVIPTIQTPFTDEEKALFEKNGLYDLDGLFKPVEQDKIEEVLGLTAPLVEDDDDFSSKSPQKKTVAAASNPDDIEF